MWGGDRWRWECKAEGTEWHVEGGVTWCSTFEMLHWVSGNMSEVREVCDILKAQSPSSPWSWRHRAQSHH